MDLITRLSVREAGNVRSVLRVHCKVNEFPRTQCVAASNHLNIFSAKKIVYKACRKQE